MLGETEDFCCKEASQGTDMPSGHRGQCIFPLAHSLLRQREGFYLMISSGFQAVALVAIVLTCNKPCYVSTLWNSTAGDCELYLYIRPTFLSEAAFPLGPAQLNQQL